MMEEQNQSARHQEIRRNLKWIATAMDAQFKGPFGIGIGWDGLLGFIPVFGEIVTTIVSIYIVLASSQLGLPFSVLCRMGLNIVFDNLVSGIPFLGWFFDFLYQSNLRNLALVDQYLATPHRVRRQSRLMLAGLVFTVLTLSGGLIALAAYLLYWLVTNWKML